MAVKYDKDSIKTLDWYEHIRLRPGMYIGKLGDGQSPDDGIYVLAKEVIDNSIDEFAMGAGKKIEIDMEDHRRRLKSTWKTTVAACATTAAASRSKRSSTACRR